ncbi:MAG: HAD domain-containing protein [Cetobacterium sp.]
MRIYLDFDGVVNAVRCWEKWPGEPDSFSYSGFTFVWSEECVAELRRLAQEDGVEFVWVTNWTGSEVELILRFMGFGSLVSKTRVLDVGLGSELGSESDSMTGMQEMASAVLTDLYDNSLGGATWGWLTGNATELKGREFAWFAKDSLLAADGIMGFVPEIDASVGVTPDDLAMVRLLGGMSRSGIGGEEE